MPKYFGPFSSNTSPQSWQLLTQNKWNMYLLGQEVAWEKAGESWRGCVKEKAGESWRGCVRESWGKLEKAGESRRKLEKARESSPAKGRWSNGTFSASCQFCFRAWSGNMYFSVPLRLFQIWYNWFISTALVGRWFSSTFSFVFSQLFDS